LKIVPITLAAAKRFNAEHHRHNALPPVSWLFGVGLEHDGELVGVGIAGRPSGRGLDNGRNVEITRTCVVDAPNGCSMIYGALCRAAAALGRERAYTYTLAEEPGSSVKAAGFVVDDELDARDAWVRPDGGRYQQDIFGNERRPPGPKTRWVRELVKAPIR
jgi:hypothetical protein